MSEPLKYKMELLEQKVKDTIIRFKLGDTINITDYENAYWESTYERTTRYVCDDFYYDKLGCKECFFAKTITSEVCKASSRLDSIKNC